MRVKTFMESLKINNAYSANKIIDWLKKFKIIGNSFSHNSNKNKGIKLIVYILSAIKYLLELFGGKLILIILLYAFITKATSDLQFVVNGDAFFQMFLFLSIAECFAGSGLLEDGDRAYYSIILLRVNAKEYTLSNYYSKMFFRFVSLLTALIITRKITGMEVEICIVYSLFNIMLKTVFNSIRIRDYKNNISIMGLAIWPLSIICIITALILPFFNITIPKIGFEIIAGVVCVLGLYSFYKLEKFNDYYIMYKNFLIPESSEVEQKMKSFNIKARSNINTIETVRSNKEGVQYLNKLFEVRYRKKMYLPIFFGSLAILLGSILLILNSISGDDMKSIFNIPQFSFMYFLVAIPLYYITTISAENVIQLAYANCDHALIGYKIYKTRKYIMESIRERIKILVKLTIAPVILTSIGGVVLLKININPNGMGEYVGIFIIAMLININTILNALIKYYIIQPYKYSEKLQRVIWVRQELNVILEMIFNICISVPMFLKLPMIKVVLYMLACSIVFWICGYILICKLAPKTFKARN